MGFETWVEVGGRLVVEYRKGTGGLPRFLFSPEDLIISPDPTDPDITESVAFVSTAGRVLAVLAEQGLGWDGAVAAYASVRSGWAAEAMLTGQYMVEVHGAADEEAQIESLLAPQRDCSPEQDLVAMGSLLAKQWLSSGPALLFKDLEYDSPIEVTGSTIGQALSAAHGSGVPPLPIARGIETLALLFREARLVAWPMLMTILLRHLPADTPVRYVLTDGIYEFEMETPPDAKLFVENYWAETGLSIAEYARNLGVLFGALADFETHLGAQYWFGQASAALNQLEALNTDRKSTTTKERGDALERLVAALMMTETEVSISEKNYRTEEEEIDLLLRNNLAAPFWTSQHSPFIFIECKNHASPMGVADLRIFESKLDDRSSSVRIGIFVSTGGYYKTFVERLKVVQLKNIGLIYAVTVEDLRGLINRREGLFEWLRGAGAIRAFDTKVMGE